MQGDERDTRSGSPSSEELIRRARESIASSPPSPAAAMPVQRDLPAPPPAPGPSAAPATPPRRQATRAPERRREERRTEEVELARVYALPDRQTPKPNVAWILIAVAAFFLLPRILGGPFAGGIAIMAILVGVFIVGVVRASARQKPAPARALVVTDRRVIVTSVRDGTPSIELERPVSAIADRRITPAGRTTVWIAFSDGATLAMRTTARDAGVLEAVLDRVTSS